MKIQDTGYKIPVGVDTMSSACGSADTKQNISVRAERNPQFHYNDVLIIYGDRGCFYLEHGNYGNKKRIGNQN